MIYRPGDNFLDETLGGSRRRRGVSKEVRERNNVTLLRPKIDIDVDKRTVDEFLHRRRKLLARRNLLKTNQP